MLIFYPTEHNTYFLWKGPILPRNGLPPQPPPGMLECNQCFPPIDPITKWVSRKTKSGPSRSDDDPPTPQYLKFLKYKNKTANQETAPPPSLATFHSRVTSESGKMKPKVEPADKPPVPS